MVKGSKNSCHSLLSDMWWNVSFPLRIVKFCYRLVSRRHACSSWEPGRRRQDVGQKSIHLAPGHSWRVPPWAATSASPGSFSTWPCRSRTGYRPRSALSGSRRPSSPSGGWRRRKRRGGGGGMTGASHAENIIKLTVVWSRYLGGFFVGRIESPLLGKQQNNNYWIN